MGQRQHKREVIEAYFRGGLTLRELGQRYGIPHQTIHRWVREAEKNKGDLSGGVSGGRVQGRQLVVRQGELPAEVRRLQKELEEARLYNELLNTMIDIAEDQLGIEIRKKSGAKRSR